MKVVVDTNVLVSAFFFGGVPGRILTAWNHGKITLVISAPILAEYREVGEDLNTRYGPLDFESFAALIVMNSEVVDAPEHLARRFVRIALMTSSSPVRQLREAA